MYPSSIEPRISPPAIFLVPSLVCSKHPGVLAASRQFSPWLSWLAATASTPPTPKIRLAPAAAHQPTVFLVLFILHTVPRGVFSAAILPRFRSFAPCPALTALFGTVRCMRVSALLAAGALALAISACAPAASSEQETAAASSSSPSPSASPFSSSPVELGLESGTVLLPVGQVAVFYSLPAGAFLSASAPSLGVAQGSSSSPPTVQALAAGEVTVTIFDMDPASGSATELASVVLVVG